MREEEWCFNQLINGEYEKCTNRKLLHRRANTNLNNNLKCQRQSKKHSPEKIELQIK